METQPHQFAQTSNLGFLLENEFKPEITLPSNKFTIIDDPRIKTN